MSNDFAFGAFDFWRSIHTSPFHFPMNADQWYHSMYDDIDSDGRKLFSKNVTRYSRSENSEMNGMINYGITAFGFDENGELSNSVYHNVIRDFWFPVGKKEVGQKLLTATLEDLNNGNRIYAFFHYFGMSACARHGKLHESSPHIHQLLLDNGFSVEHENIYYSRQLAQADITSEIKLIWKSMNTGSCREFSALMDSREIGWGQVHFLPQGDIAYLRWIYIDEHCQHQGLGTQVMHSLFTQLYNMGIRRFDTDTARNNTIAQRYYEKNGFINDGITRSYYRL